VPRRSLKRGATARVGGEIQDVEGSGGLDRTRICDLLRVKQAL
jgi:hypothetical protein